MTFCVVRISNLDLRVGTQTRKTLDLGKSMGIPRPYPHPGKVGKKRELRSIDTLD